MTCVLLMALWVSAPGNEAPAIEKDLLVRDGVSAAEIEIAAGGFYEVYLDGRKLGDRVLDPSPTDYSKTVLSVRIPFDVMPGSHVVRILLGHGWYDQRSVSAWNNNRDRWRKEPCVRAEVRISYQDGRVEKIGTDKTWRQVRSPLVYDDFREGEIVDPGFVMERRGLGDWVVEVEGPKGKVVPMTHPPARIVREIPLRKSWRTSDGFMLDFGENLAGWARIRFRGGRRGDLVTIRYDERVQPNGEPCVRVERKDVPRRNKMELWPSNARAIDCFVFGVGSTNILQGGAMQQDRFVLSGAVEDVYEPRFVYHGFRYVHLRGVSALPEAVACEIRTDFPVIGHFECSDRDVNDLMRMAMRSYESNFTDGVPTDCPHREKNGWTADAQIASEFAQYAYENTEAYLKWIVDLVDAQREDGAMPGVVPSGAWGYNDGRGFGPIWDSALAIVPWNLYVYRDDDRGLRLVCDALFRNLDYHLSLLDNRGLVTYGLGDWISCGHYTEPEFCASAYLYGMLTIGTRIGEVLGRSEADRFRKAAARLKSDFNRVFYVGGGQYADGYQTQQALPITFGLCSDETRESVGEMLIKAVHDADDHMDFGLVGSKHVFRALSSLDRTDLALKMLKQVTRPSFLSWRNAGSSTLWEDWETGFSRNHIMFGDFACWAYQYLAGIRLPDGGSLAVPDPGARGLKSLKVNPVGTDGLEWVRASLLLPDGKLERTR